MNIKDVPKTINSIIRDSNLTAREKQALKMALPILDKYTPKDAVDGKCPSCGREVNGMFCNCGQRIKKGRKMDWWEK